MASDEPVNTYVLYKSRNVTSGRRGAPRTTYFDQIAEHIYSDKMIKGSLEEIVKYTKDKKHGSRYRRS